MDSAAVNYRITATEPPPADALVGAPMGDGCAYVGCTQSTARNYDPKATVNTNTWCLPMEIGCMMPMTGNSGSTSNYEGSTIHYHQGLAINFNPSATVNDVSMCVYKYEGCTDSTMINYNSHATVDDGSCFPIVVGCLDRSAENFNCTFPGVNDGTDT